MVQGTLSHLATRQMVSDQASVNTETFNILKWFYQKISFDKRIKYVIFFTVFASKNKLKGFEVGKLLVWVPYPLFGTIASGRFWNADIFRYLKVRWCIYLTA